MRLTVSTTTCCWVRTWTSSGEPSRRGGRSATNRRSSCTIATARPGLRWAASASGTARPRPRWRRATRGRLLLWRFPPGASPRGRRWYSVVAGASGRRQRSWPAPSSAYTSKQPSEADRPWSRWLAWSCEVTLRPDIEQPERCAARGSHCCWPPRRGLGGGGSPWAPCWSSRSRRGQPEDRTSGHCAGRRRRSSPTRPTAPASGAEQHPHARWPLYDRGWLTGGLPHEQAPRAVHGVGVLAGCLHPRHLVESAHEGPHGGLHHIGRETPARDGDPVGGLEAESHVG